MHAHNAQPTFFSRTHVIYTHSLILAYPETSRRAKAEKEAHSVQVQDQRQQRGSGDAMTRRGSSISDNIKLAVTQARAEEVERAR